MRPIAVVVQLMINSVRAGAAFTADPGNGAEDRVVIEVVVSGEVDGYPSSTVTAPR